MYASALDIANRALQLCGQIRISAFTDNAKAATEIAFAYAKLRRVVLRRNIWKFAVKKVALRAMTSTTQRFWPSAWAVGTTYSIGALVSYTDPANQYSSSQVYISLASSNIGNAPSDTSFKWVLFSAPNACDTYSATVPYYVNEIVVANEVAYLSLINANLNNAPASSATDWVPLAGTITPLELVFPIGTGPVTDPATLNVFPLPLYFIRQAQQDPKAGIMPVPGAPSGILYRDWDAIGQFLTTRDTGPIIYRFAADMLNVGLMDDLFCEAFACRLAIGVIETLAQSSEKLKNLVSIYVMSISDARAVNSIEGGSTEMPETDFYLLGQQPQGQQQRQG